MITFQSLKTIKFPLPSWVTRSSQIHMTCCHFSSINLEASTSQGNVNQALKSIPLSPSVKKKGSRLRDKAGLPTLEYRDLNHPTSFSQSLADSSDIMQMKQSNVFRTRTQLERTQMSHGERSIALELLEELGIPIEELETSSPSSTETDQTDPRSQSPINDLFQRPEFKSILLHQKYSSNKNLLRNRPSQISPEEIRFEDMLKELTDSHIRKIDSFETDFQLLDWVDEVVFSQSSKSLPQTSTFESDFKLESNDERDMNENTNLGGAFEKHQSNFQSNTGMEGGLDYIHDLDSIIKQPICFTPLFSPILLHLLKLTSNKLKNPHLALYLFNWVRSHRNPVVKYFGLTRDTYFENLQIKWQFFLDFKGIKDDLLDMNAMGLELDERFKNFIQSITRVVWEDELDSENLSNALQTSPLKLGQSQIIPPRISQAERSHVSQIESILQDFIECQNHAFTRKLRAPPAGSN